MLWSDLRLDSLSCPYMREEADDWKKRAWRQRAKRVHETQRRRTLVRMRKAGSAITGAF
jgi:ribosomal protein L18E